MIKINELRIGNRVLAGYGNFQYVTEILDYGINTTQSDNAEYTLEELSGIPLTPEILEKCGFLPEESNDYEERKIYGIQVANNTSLYYDPEIVIDSDGNKGINKTWYLSHEWNNNHFQNDFWNKPEYLHQLQNLYFALTGDELQVNL